MCLQCQENLAYHERMFGKPEINGKTKGGWQRLLRQFALLGYFMNFLVSMLVC